MPANANNKEVVAGTTIHEERPFVCVLSSKFRTECCDFCFKKWPQLSKCSNCKYSYYCGRTCQKQSWTVHKLECKHLKRISPRILPDAARLLYRLIRKLENGGATVKGYYTKKDYRMWRDLMSHYAELKTDKTRTEHMTSLYGVLMEFMEGDGLPNFVEFMGLYGRMCVNSFNICNQELQSLGTGIYLGASIIDHSCRPNALAVFEGTTLFIRTLETLPELDWTKIRISYIDVMASTGERQKELLTTYYFLCDCPKCTAPENMCDMFGAACPNKSCDGSVLVNEAKCDKCGTLLAESVISAFNSTVEFTEMHLGNMKNTTYLDVCKICLEKHKGVLNPRHLKHVKVLDMAFEACIDLGDFDTALDYGLELIESYYQYYPLIHPLNGLLHLKLCKLLLYKNRTKEGVTHLRKASDILKVTHSSGSSLYKSEVMPLIQQCRTMLNFCFEDRLCMSGAKRMKLNKMFEEVSEVLKRLDAVCFDVDSTVIREEGIDELAKFCGKGCEVTNLTSQAMSGTMTFQESLELRLNIIRPSIAQVKDFILKSPPTLTPGIKTLVDFLHSRRIPVYLISGGFRSIIAPIADQLKIPQSNVFANRLKFYFNGEYAGFDDGQPTSRSGGKAVVVRHLKEKFGFKNLILVGDGVTDLEASPPADAFIGYGGNVIRPAVKAKAKWFVTDFNEITNVLVNQQNI